MRACASSSSTTTAPSASRREGCWRRRTASSSAEASSGEHALARVRRTEADLVLSTCSCRASTGSRRRAAAAAAGGPQVVLISSRPLDDVGVDRVADCGARGFVHKADLSRAALDLLVA